MDGERIDTFDSEAADARSDEIQPCLYRMSQGGVQVADTIEKLAGEIDSTQIWKERQSLDEFHNLFRRDVVEFDADEMMPVRRSNHEVKAIVADLARQEFLQ